MEMVPVPGYASASWSAGYGDFILRPDFSSLRLLPWLDATALLICDVYSENGQPVAQSPRHILQRQLRRLTDRGMRAYFASELEFYLLMRPIPRYQERIITFPRYLEVTIRTIVFCRQRGRSASCVRSETVYMVLGSRLNVQREKGRWSGEINVRHSDPLLMADQHTIIKHGSKEIAAQHGKSITYMAKWNDNYAGSSSHVHGSLWSSDGRPFL